MAENSKIEWCDHTFNPWVGCTKVSAACDNCYAEAWAKRAGRNFSARRLTTDANWRQPFRWNTAAREAGTRSRVFCASLADVFDSEVPDEWRDRLFALVALTPRLDWLLLTKRPKVARNYMPDIGSGDAARWTAALQSFVGQVGALALGDALESLTYRAVLPNVWLGTTVETQAMADARIPMLLGTPAAVHFLSCEPLLGPVNIDRGTRGTPGIDWVIAGGESGPRARPSHPDWFRGLRDQCQQAEVPFLFKQWGEWHPDALLYTTPGGMKPPPNMRIGKKRSGRILDGRLWDETPFGETCHA